MGHLRLQGGYDRRRQLAGFLYHHARGLIAGRGEKAVFAAGGKKTVEPLCDAAEALKHFKPDDWNT